MDTVVLKKILNWAKTPKEDEETELSITLRDLDESFSVVFEPKTKIEYDGDFITIWEITTAAGATSPQFFNLNDLLHIEVA